MSNPAVYRLAETMIGNTRVCIEDNLGEAIHIHIGSLRITLSIEEFQEVVAQVEKSTNELLKMNSLDINMFDKRAFDWDWLYRYENIEKIELVSIEIGSLLTKGEVELAPELSKIVPIAESRQYKALEGNCNELCKYSEINDFGISNIERLKNVMELIKRNGYPYDKKYILVNQYNQIYDGDHRAACLLYLKGEKARIPVLKITFSDEKKIEKQIEDEKNELKKYIENKNNQMLPVHHWSEELNTLDIKFDDLERKLTELKYAYYIIEHCWSDKNGKMVADKVIVIQENEMIELCKALQISYYGKSIYRHYQFLYSMQRCVYMEVQDAKVLLFDRLACCSKFENAILPLDKAVQSFAWENVTNNRPGVEIELIYVVINALLNGQGFSNEDKAFMRKMDSVLETEEISKLLKTIFFKYADKLLSHLKKHEYEEAYYDYITNVSY